MLAPTAIQLWHRNNLSAMTDTPHSAIRARPAAWPALVFAAAIGGCTLFSSAGDETASSRLSGRSVSAAGKPFPNLASVPERPVPLSSTAQRARLRTGLAADRAAALAAPGTPESVGAPQPLAVLPFAGGSAALAPVALDVLRDVAERHREGVLRVVGRGDDDAHDPDLSRARAAAAAAELRRLGVAAARIEIDIEAPAAGGGGAAIYLGDPEAAR